MSLNRFAKFKSAKVLAFALICGGLFVALSRAGGSIGETEPAPSVQVVQGYLNRTFLTTHTTKPFDSSGGDLIVVCASSHNGVMMTPSDSFNNKWESAAGPKNTNVGFDLRTQVWYAKEPKVGPGDAFTLNLSLPQPLVISIIVVKGADPADPIDAISGIGEDGGARAHRVVSPTITTTVPDDLLIGFSKSSRPEEWYAGLGFSQLDKASSDFLAAESDAGVPVDTYHSTFYTRHPATWQAVVVAVKPKTPRTSAQPTESLLGRFEILGNSGS